MEDLNDPGTTSIEGKPALGFEISHGKDEMNLAEFPIAAIGDRVPNGQKTLVFEDRKHDFGKNEWITQRVTIAASEKYGLPTALDDEVVLGLIQLSKQKRFAERKVKFSRYQLIQVLGWRNEGPSYKRLEKSLKRWLGVTLYYEKAWWDQDEQSYVDENFHILDNVTLYDQERRLTKLRGDSAEKLLSSFTWNEVVFRSFKSGYLKTLDLSIFRQLDSSVAKRMFRFLDKRFYHNHRWKFDLKEFACEHIGLAKTYDTGGLKRVLKPAIEELENVGFLEPMALEQRFIKITRGQWDIIFVEKARAQTECLPMNQGLSKQLVERGVTASVAKGLVKEFPGEVIERQIAAFDSLSQAKRSLLHNPAGFLVKSIREGYSSPRNAAAKESVVPAQSKISRRPSIAVKKDPVSHEVNAYLRSLSKEELTSLEGEALKRATPLVADGYYRSKETGGQAHEDYRSMLLESEAKRILDAESPK